MLSKLDQKQVDRLYTLLERGKDADTAAALRWAIFQLEQQGREKQTGDLVYRLAFTPEPEINSIADTGAFNEIIKGYLVTALQDTGKERAEVIEALDTLEAAFDNTGGEQARRAYREI